MVTVKNMKGEVTAEMELVGLSTDTKPTGSFSGAKIAENSVFLELDTGDLYFLTDGTWEKMGG